VLDRNDSHRFWFRAAAQPYRPGADSPTIRATCVPSPVTLACTRVINDLKKYHGLDNAT